MLRNLFHRLFGRPEFNSASSHVLLWLLRGAFGAIIIGLAMVAFKHYGAENTPRNTTNAYTAFFVILGIGLVVLIGDIVVRNKQITTLSAVYFGTLLGMLLGYILAAALDPFIFGFFDQPGTQEGVKRKLFTLFITVISCYVCISTLIQTKDEFRFIIPYVEFSREVKGARALLLDTSVIIDGRIADVCDTRLIDTPLIVPRFVLQELQSIADSSDKLKRNRGRRGLDILKRMQNNEKVDLEIHEANIPELRGIDKVDERLVAMGKVLGARVVTNDFNLNKIAQLQGVEVINLNELANAMKSVALPGETLPVRIVKPGDQIGQGVGYLDDGTMVVIEQGRSHIGHDVLIVVTSVLQTPAGRMIFGRIEGRINPPGSNPGFAEQPR